MLRASDRAGPEIRAGPLRVRNLFHADGSSGTGGSHPGLADGVQQADFGLQEDPLNLLLRIHRASCLAAAGRAKEAAEGYREILELNPSMVLAKFNLAGRHVSRGELDQALPLCEEAYALAP